MSHLSTRGARDGPPHPPAFGAPRPSRVAPLHSPTLGRAPAEPSRTSGLTQDVSSFYAGSPRWPPTPPSVRSAPAKPGRSSTLPDARTRPGGAVAYLGADTGCLIFLRGEPEMAPHTPQRSERPGEAGSLLYTPRRSDAPRRSRGVPRG